MKAYSRSTLLERNTSLENTLLERNTSLENTLLENTLLENTLLERNTSLERDVLLEVRDLEVSFQGIETVNVLSGISFSIKENETLALVGETGCGKSVVAHAVMNLLPPESRVKGNIEFRRKNLLGMNEKEMAKIRGKEIAIIFQNPALALNPVYSIGHQLAEPLYVHQKEKKKTALSRAALALKRMGFANFAECMNYYPSWCSGGMNQRFLIAASTILNPSLLIADEPSKGLDKNA